MALAPPGTWGTRMGTNWTPGYDLTAKRLANRVTAAKTLNADWVRISYEVNWEPSFGPTSIYAQYVAALHAAGFKVLQCIQGIDAADAVTNTTNHAPCKNTTALAHWVSRVTSMGAYPDAIEIGNEWNANFFMYQIKANVAMVQQMIKQASVSLKAAYPTLPLVHVGLTPYIDDANGYDPVKFLQAMLALDPTHLDSFDGVGWHPYTYPGSPTTEVDQWGWCNYTKKIQLYLNSIGKALPLWMTEYGTPTAGGPNAFTEAGQAAHQDLYFQAFDNLRADVVTPCNIAYDFVYELNDDGVSYYEGNMGIYSVGGGSTVVTTRPSTFVASLGVTLFGGTTLQGVLKDDNDASWAFITPGGFGQFKFAPFTVPTGSGLVGTVLRVRARRKTTATSILNSSMNSHTVIQMNFFQAVNTYATIASANQGYFSVADLAAGVSLYFMVDHDIDVAEMYLDITYSNPAGTYTVKQPIHDVVTTRAAKDISGIIPPPPTTCD